MFGMVSAIVYVEPNKRKENKMFKDRLIKEIATFLNVDKKTLILNTNEKKLDELVELWDNGNTIEIHHFGYSLK